MNTLYCTLPEEVQYFLASMLSLQTEERKPHITLNYTGSEPQYPEKILNLKWSFEGDWRILNLKKFFAKEDDEKVWERFLEIFQIAKKRNYSVYNNHAAWLFQIAQELEVRGEDFAAGVTNLFKRVTERTEIKVNDQSLFVPDLLLKREAGEHYSSFEMFIYVESEKTFMNIMQGNRTPNYVKDFLEAEANMLKA